MEAWQKNVSQIDLLRTVMALTMGALSGILGLTSLRGLLFYVAASVVVGVATAIPMGFDTKMYTNASLPNLILQSLQGQAMTFIMSWTLTYALVNLF